MKIATLDCETDPFQHGREVCPFACGLYDGENYFQTWGDNCIAEMVDYLRVYSKPLIIFAHNGGKFDYCFFADYVQNPLMFIQTRLVKARLFHHELRDSFAILPVKLSAFEKDKIDYSVMEYGAREDNRQTISDYLESDCRYLYKAVKRFIDEFGLKLTIGSTAMKELRKHHKFQTMIKDQDNLIRPFYFGGRVQCFESGEIHANLKCYDINSSYPFAMKTARHPISAAFCATRNPPEHAFYFSHIIADSNGALPIRTQNGLEFPRIQNGEFFACSHEIQTAQDLGLLKIKKILCAYVTANTTCFGEFVDHCMENKLAAENDGDRSMRLFWKLIANSAYGKFGQNPDNYTESALFPTLTSIEESNENLPLEQKWKPRLDYGSRILAERPAPHAFRLNVATAASITSAARAHLLRAIATAKRPIYCDTDSLICESAPVKIHPTTLGAWKCEAHMDSLFIAGKKIYAGFQRGEPVKTACKGAILTPEQIREIVRSNKPFEYKRAAPSMRMFAPQKFITRQISATAK